MAEVPFNKAGV